MVPTPDTILLPFPGPVPGAVPIAAQVVPLTTQEQYQALLCAAAEDHHTVVGPTHIVVKGGQVVGYGSLGAVPMLNVWVHSAHVNKFESVRLLRQAESMLAALGARMVILPVDENSPFRKYVTKLGYKNLGNASYNLKILPAPPVLSPSTPP